MKFPVRDPKHAIFCNGDWGPTFGLSNDLSARDSPFNKKNAGTSNGAGETYFGGKGDVDEDDDNIDQA